MTDSPPQNREQATRLLEIPPTITHTDLTGDEPVAIFLDHDERLMKVVLSASGAYRKVCME